jgi:hypothetical protein
MSDMEATMTTTRTNPGKKRSASGAVKIRGTVDPGRRKTKLLLAGSSTSDTRVALGKAGLERLARRHPDVARALAELASASRITGTRSEKISARVDPGVLGAAAERLGLDRRDVSDVVNASLAVAAAPDRFKAWLRDTEDTLPDDFELAI